MASEAKTIDLHGAKGQPFPGFDEDETYLERVTIPTRAEAQEAIATEFGVNPEETNPQPIFMRYDDGEEIADFTSGDFEEGWWECDESHPDAVPFWKDRP